MKLNKYFFYCFVAIITSYQLAYSMPSHLNDYVDYVPKYRGQNKNFIIAKIEYTSSKMILYFRYVASSEEEAISFSGGSTPNPWKLFTSSRDGSGLKKYASLQNITINGKLKTKKIDNGDNPQFLARRGEIVSGEAHFSKLPSNVRSVNFSAGDLAICHDILIKDSSSPMLGTPEQMNGSVDRFYNMLSSFGVDVIKQPEEAKTVESTSDTKSQMTKQEAIIRKAEEPVNYIPKALTSAEDLECDTRVILKNVYFNDNSAIYAGRVEAMATIRILVEYMNYYHQSTIILHGHTDVYGSNIKNIELSKKRVLAVRNSLVTAGIEGDRIMILHHGSEQPLPGFEKGGKRNRRVEAEISCEKQ